MRVGARVNDFVFTASIRLVRLACLARKGYSSAAIAIAARLTLDFQEVLLEGLREVALGIIGNEWCNLRCIADFASGAIELSCSFDLYDGSRCAAVRVSDFDVREVDVHLLVHTATDIVGACLNMGHSFIPGI